MRAARSSILAIPLLALLLGLALPRMARAADRPFVTPFGEKGELAFDNLTGLRLSYPFSMNYAGPLGFKTESIVTDNLDGHGSTTTSTTAFWIAPAADYFVWKHLSIGGELVLATQSGTVTAPGFQADLPSTTDVTFEPRVGWLFAVTDRFGIWPRGGLGYFSHEYALPGVNAAGTVVFNRDGVHGAYLHGSCGFLYRINETFFLDAAPELYITPGASHSEVDAIGNSVSRGASVVQFGIFSGLGIFLDLR